MMSSPTQRRPPTRTFAEEVESLTAVHVGPLDALMRDQALRVTAEVLVHAIVKTNNQLAVGQEPPDPFERRAEDVDLWADTDRVAREILRLARRKDRSRTSRPWMKHAVRTLVADRFDRARYEDFLDTDEIPGLVAAAYGLGLTMRHMRVLLWPGHWPAADCWTPVVSCYRRAAATWSPQRSHRST